MIVIHMAEEVSHAEPRIRSVPTERMNFLFYRRDNDPGPKAQARLLSRPPLVLLPLPLRRRVLQKVPTS